MTETIGSPWLWGGFIVFIFAMLALDLGVFHRKTHAVRFTEALAWSGVWVSLALLFNAGLWARYGSQVGVEFLTGYLIEKSLSLDNIFLFVVIFGALGIPALYQHRVLFWGVIGALLLRAAMIFAGAALLERFHFLIYVFGGLLVLTGVKMYVQRGKAERPEDSPLLKLVRRFVPATQKLEGDRFFTLEHGRRLATPLFLALVLVEAADVVFAVDSIPAIFAITRDPFLVFTSNIFAILGLRSLFFLVAGLVERFAYLKVALSAILIFVGFKMVLVDLVKVPALASLAVIVSILGTAVFFSWRRNRAVAAAASSPAGVQEERASV
ncbi:MAG: TerC family protein [Deltaproteobacteria bacterium]|nr:TerC family protein [Deltaproteobacteria bacterium]